MRKVFLDNLPKKEGIGANKNKMVIDWKKSIDKKIKFIYDNIKGELKIIDYNTKIQKLSLIYLDENVFQITPQHFKECKLKELLGLKTIKYKYNIGDIVKTNNSKIKILKQIRIKINSKYKKNRTEKGYEYICLKCKNINTIMECHLKIGKSCPICLNQKIIKGINDIATTHPYLVKFFVNKNDTYIYSIGSNVNIKAICPKCNNIKTIRLYDLYKYGVSCPKCGDGFSYPNKFMFNILEQLHINFKTEYSPKWCKYKINNKNKQGKYDFYFKSDNKKYIIEMDGEWHDKDNKMSGQTAKESQYIDNYKDKIAEKHSIEVIRIDCRKSELEWIKNSILNSELTKLFNLSNIDWLKCHEYACCNLVKKVCNLWNNGINSTKKISSIIHISHSAVLKYLKQGLILKWCDYSPQKSRQSIEFKKAKPVICLENGIIFQSAKEIEEKSLEVFNLKLRANTIRQACGGYFKKYKGYTFKYILDNNLNN